MALKLWTPPESRQPYVFVGEDWEIEFGPELGEDEVYCDLCNATILLRPVPVVDGYALCLECLPTIEPKWKELVTPLLKLIWQTQVEMASE